MAAGMWQGLLAGYKNIEEKQAAREAKEEELMEKRKALALKIAALRGTNSFSVGTSGTTSEGSTGGGSTGGSIEHSAQVLKSQFNLSDETITRVAGTAGAAGLNQALEILERTRKRYSDLGQEMPKDVVTNLFDSAVLTGAPEDDLDFGKLEDYIGGALDPLEMELLTLSRASTGQAYFPEPSVLPAPPLEDVNRLEQRAISDSRQKATGEIRNISLALNKVRTSEEQTTDPNALSELKATKAWLTERQMGVKEALESAAGDGGNPTGLVNLYGNEFFQEMFKSYPMLSTAVLSSAFKDVQPAAPKRVVSSEDGVSPVTLLENLVNLGAINPNEVSEITDSVTGDFVPAASRKGLEDLASRVEFVPGQVVYLYENGTYVRKTLE